MNIKEKSGEMTRKNWTIVFSGVLLFLFGFIVLSLVGKDYHGFKGFLSPFLLILGLITVIAGLVYTDKKAK